MIDKYILLLIMWNLRAADSSANHKMRQICLHYPFITPYSMYIFCRNVLQKAASTMVVSVKILTKNHMLERKKVLISENHVCGFQEQGRV